MYLISIKQMFPNTLYRYLVHFKLFFVVVVCSDFLDLVLSSSLDACGIFVLVVF